MINALDIFLYSTTELKMYHLSLCFAAQDVYDIAVPSSIKEAVSHMNPGADSGFFLGGMH